MNSFQTKTCPKCGALKMKDWTDLGDEQKLLVERLPRNAEFTRAERKKHRFCERCWFEKTDDEIKFA